MHTKILKRCGWVLVVIGVLDIAYMIRCIAYQQNYSSSLNLFALVGGILLIRGGLKTSRWVASLATFTLAACIVGLLTVPLMFPFGYWFAVMKHNPGTMPMFAIAVAFLGLLVWVRQRVLHPEVLAAQHSAGLPPPRIKAPLVMGIALPILLVALLGLMLRGDTAHEAMRRAEQQLGGNYRYVVTSMQMNSSMQEKRVSAVVTAYNETEMKSIQVHWKE